MNKLIKTLAGGLLTGALAVMISSGTAYAADVEINESNFSDKAFRAYVEEKIDKNSDKKLSEEEIADVTYINVRQRGISSLKGISYFKNLKSLNCSGNELDSLSLKDNTALVYIDASGNEIEEVSFENNKMLETVDLSKNDISKIDISKCTRLSTLDISYNQLASIDTTNAVQLSYLEAAGNQLTSVNLAANVSLNTLNLKENTLVLLDLVANDKLVNVDCSYNNLLDVKLPESVQTVNMNGNYLTDVDLTSLTELANLSLADNKLYGLDISANVKLTKLDLSGNYFAAFDFSANPLLTKENVDVTRNEREVYVDKTNIADLTGTYINLDKISKIDTADVTTGEALTVGKEGKFPEKVSYTYDAGNGIEAAFTLIPEGTKKIIAKNNTISIYIKDGDTQPSYPVSAVALGGNAEISWSSADSKIAKVDENGNVVPVAVGQTTLTALAKDYDLAVVTVNVLREGQSVSIATIDNQYYTGKEIKPIPVVKMGDITLNENIDYTVSYTDNTDVGTAYVTIKGKGIYTFEIIKKFNICYNIANMISEAIPDQIYTGAEVTPDVIIKNNATTLVKDIDYTLSYTNNKALGTAIVTITGKGKYAGTKIQSFNIVVEQVKNLRVSTRKATSLTLTWDVVSGADGYRIYKYDTATKKYKYLKQLNGKDTNSYMDANLTQGTQYRYRVRAFKLIDNVKKYGKYCPKYKTYTKPKKVSLKTKKGSKKVTLSWTKVTGAQGYRIYMKKGNGKFSKIKEIKKGSTVSYTKSGLTKGKTYYFKARAYREIDGVKVYGAYSKIKTVIVK